MAYSLAVQVSLLSDGGGDREKKSAEREKKSAEKEKKSAADLAALRDSLEGRLAGVGAKVATHDTQLSSCFYSSPCSS